MRERLEKGAVNVKHAPEVPAGLDLFELHMAGSYVPHYDGK